MSADLLLEVGCEEIPARFLPPAMADLKRLVEERLAEARIDRGSVYTSATPRRLVAHVADLAPRQRDEQIEKLGPAWSAAFDADGNPTPAAAGFAKGQGIDPKRLQRIDTDKGPRAGVRKN
ncbi:MAG: glycine--tRNA ligase subunit beta [Deltaproteobacteria bacterium]|nr:glycine--tRNA ligase subunit beta [Deltaproteobacteria bacterium]